MAVRDVLIVGGGPSGLSAAIAAKQHGLDYVVVEQGVLVNSIFRFPPQMVFFTTPELLEIGGVPFVSPYDKPTRQEALRYYRKVADAHDLQIAFDERVVAVRRDEAEQIFEIETHSSKGVRRVRLARSVVFAIGYYDHPVRLGIPGEDLPHVSHYFGDPHLHYRQRAVIVGGGNSAAEAALLLYRAGAHVTLVHRQPTLKRTIKYWVRPDIENRIKEGTIAARFGAALSEIRPASVVVRAISEMPADDEPARQRELFADADASHAPAAEVVSPSAPATDEIAADAVYLLTGYRADGDLLCRAGVRLNDRDAPIFDPETFETNVPNLFVAGGAVAGRDTGTIFIENGRFHGEKIVDVISARLTDRR
ncbi:MAG TPA: NAD(P)-binding domain-containing protein [Vicinamibacterales bacterium]|nr:NAD(P)-binding domain-containing protein [Vicinamibacterales bacterium]